VPHALYDIERFELMSTLARAVTPASFPMIRFATGGWYTYGTICYPLATSILLLMDGGGSNSSRHYIFKQDLQALVDEIGILKYG